MVSDTLKAGSAKEKFFECFANKYELQNMMK